MAGHAWDSELYWDEETQAWREEELKALGVYGDCDLRRIYDPRFPCECALCHGGEP